MFIIRGSKLRDIDRAIRRRHIAAMGLADAQKKAHPTVESNMAAAGRWPSETVSCCRRYFGACGEDEDEVRLIDEEIRNLVQALATYDKTIDDEIIKRQSHGEITASAAYVTFEEEEGKDRALVAYPDTFCMWLCQP